MAPVSPSLTTPTVHRFDARGSTWAVATEAPLDEVDAREVAERLELR